MIAIDELLAAARARASRPTATAQQSHLYSEPRSTPQVLPVDEQAVALWSWVQGKDAAQRWDRPWTRERVADAHAGRRRNAGQSGGISGTAWVAHGSESKRRPATAGVRRPPELLADAGLQPVRPVARSRRRRGGNAALLAGIPVAPALDACVNPMRSRPLAPRPQSAGPAIGGRTGVSCMHVDSGWMWGAFEGRYGKEAKRAVRIIQRRWRAWKRGQLVRQEFTGVRAAAFEVQRRVRGWLAKRECERRRRHDKEVLAALRIQIAWRGLCGRQVAAGIRAKQVAHQMAIAAESARRIQRMWRGKNTRRELLPWLREARAIRDRHLAEELAAAARIEAMRRTRRMAEARRQRLEQARLRRKHTPTMREATNFLKQSVARRQFSQWQALQERRKVATAGASASGADPTSTKGIAQAVIRSELQLRAAKAERWRRGQAATVIQRWWRPIARHLREALENAAALTLQCNWRALLARRQAAEMRRRRAERAAAARAAIADQLRKLAEVEADALQKLLESGLGKREGVPHVEPFETSQHEAEVVSTMESMLQTLQATLAPWTSNDIEPEFQTGICQSSTIARVDARTALEQARFAAESESFLALERTRRQDEQNRVDLAEVEDLLGSGRALAADCDWEATILVLQRAEKLVPHGEVLVAERVSALLKEAEVALNTEARRVAFAEAKKLVAAAVEAAATLCAPHGEAEHIRPRLKARVVETSVDWVESAEVEVSAQLHTGSQDASIFATPSFNDCYDVWVKNNIQHGHLSEAAMRDRVHLCADPPSCLDLDQHYQVSTFIDSTSLTAASFASDSLTFCDGGVADGPAWRASLSNGDALLNQIASGATGPFFALPKEQQLLERDEDVAALNLITGSAWRLVNISCKIPDTWHHDEVHTFAHATANSIIMTSLDECSTLQTSNSDSRGANQSPESRLLAREQEVDLEVVSGPEEYASVVSSQAVLQPNAELANREALVAAREPAVVAREAPVNQQNVQYSETTAMAAISRNTRPTTAAEWYQHLMDSGYSDGPATANHVLDPFSDADAEADVQADAKSLFGINAETVPAMISSNSSPAVGVVDGMQGEPKGTISHDVTAAKLAGADPTTAVPVGAHIDRDCPTPESVDWCSVALNESVVNASASLQGDAVMETPESALEAAVQEIQHAVLIASPSTPAPLLGTRETPETSSPGPLYASLLAEYVEFASDLCEADRHGFERELAALKFMETEAAAQTMGPAIGQNQMAAPALEALSDPAATAACSEAAKIVRDAVDAAADYAVNLESPHRVESAMLRPAPSPAPPPGNQQDEQRDRARRVHFAPSPLKAQPRRSDGV